MENSFSKTFTFPELFRFSLPNILMQIFLSLYTIVDGIFVSRYVGSIALGSVNIVFPLTCLEMAISIMLATGGSAIVAFRMGSGRLQKAQENFSLLTAITGICGLLTAVLGLLFMPQIVRLLGASDLQFDFCVQYGTILSLFAPVFFLQILFQTFFITAGKPGLGLAVTIAAGFANMIFDYLFIREFAWGIAGAALATGIGYCIPALTGLFYFAFRRKGILHFVMPRLDLPMLLSSCSNGASEMVTNLANASTTFLFNIFFMRFYGEAGVAAISIVLYFQFLFLALYFGYSMGVAPIVSYKYGCGDKAQLYTIITDSIKFLAVISVVIYLVSIGTVSSALQIFTGSDAEVYAITRAGFPYFAISFLFMGFSIFASSMFTALSNGLVSAVISFGRTFLFLIGMILILPAILGATGLWLAIPVAEFMGLIVSIWCYLKNRRRYLALPGKV